MERIYRALLALYPRRFRELFADEMVELVRDQLRGRRASARARIWWRTLLALLPSAVAEHAAEVRRRAPLPLRRRKDTMWESLAIDVRYALRGLRHRPGLTLLVTITLALGIGANTTLYSVVDAVLLRPLPYADADELVTVSGRYGAGPGRTALSPPDFIDRRDRSSAFVSAAAYMQRPMSLVAGGAAESLNVGRVTSKLFATLGVRPALGRVSFPPADGAGDARVAVLSHGLWKRLFGGAEEAIGAKLQLDGQSYEVVAVMPPGVDLPRGSDLWIPLTFTPRQLADDFRGNEYLAMVARLAPDMTMARAQAEMDVVTQWVLDNVPDRRDYLQANAWGVELGSLTDEVVGKVRPALLALLGAVVLVLLIACANVANLLLASGAGRSREMAVRGSLGASRARLVRQLLTESFLLSAAGGTAGLLFAAVSLRAVPAWVPHDVPRLAGLSLDLRVLVFGIALTAATGLLFGLLPAWQVSRAGLQHADRGAGASTGRAGRRLRGSLVVQQVAVALVLLIGAGLLLRSFERLADVDPGFVAGDQLTFHLAMPSALYDAESRATLLLEALERLRAMPGVDAVAVADNLPLDGNRWHMTFHAEGHEPGPGEKETGADFNTVSPDYFKALGIPFLAGRDFRSFIDRDAPEAIVDRWTAERFWGVDDTVGRRILLGERTFEIVGVVGHVKRETLDEEGHMQIYLPYVAAWNTEAVFVVAAGNGGLRRIAQARRELGDLAPQVPVFKVRTASEVAAGSVTLRRFNLGILGAFALLALALAAVGLYGVAASSVCQRTAEIGVRMALGARPGTIAGMVLREGLMLVALGLALGWLGALGLTRWMAGLLYGVRPTDPGTFIVLSLLLSLVAVLATYVPARRAARLDPVDALRTE